jgi:hypothetical protein
MLNHRNRWMVVAAGAMLLLATAATAQTSTMTESKSFEVISVDGNNLVLRGADGSTKEFVVPADFRFDVGGQMLAVSALKPGMKGTATITTTTTVHPVYVTEVKSGEVLKVSGGSVIVRTDQGIRSFTPGEMEKRNVTIIREGKPVVLSDLHVGDRLNATIVTEGEPHVVSERDVQASVTPHAAPAGQSSQSAAAPAPAPASSSAAAGSSPATLPPTASPLPLIGLIGTALLAIGYSLTLRRRRQ